MKYNTIRRVKGQLVQNDKSGNKRNDTTDLITLPPPLTRPVNKSVFSKLRQLTTWNCPHSSALQLSAGRAAIHRYLLPAGPTAATGLLLLVHAGTDRWTDTIPLHRPCSSYYASSANNRSIVDTIGWLGSRVVSMLDSGAEGPSFKS